MVRIGGGTLSLRMAANNEFDRLFVVNTFQRGRQHQHGMRHMVEAEGGTWSTHGSRGAAWSVQRMIEGGGFFINWPSLQQVHRTC